MGRQNTAILVGIVEQKAHIFKNEETGENEEAILCIHTVRGVKNAHDGNRIVKHEYPLIIAQMKHIISGIESWEVGDIVAIKGSFYSRKISKKMICPECGREKKTNGLLSYVAPIYAKRIAHYDSTDDALKELLHNKEISNQAILIGTVMNNPSSYRIESGLIVTQYQVVTNRKLKIKADSPETKMDYIWVKSFGDQAVEDKLRLRHDSIVLIDGYLQSRNIKRKIKCPDCGYFYGYNDTTMELVPYDCEYLQGTFMTNEMLEEEFGMDIEKIKEKVKREVKDNHAEKDVNKE